MNAVRYTNFLLCTPTIHPILALAVLHPRTSVGPVVRMRMTPRAVSPMRQPLPCVFTTNWYDLF